MTASAEAAGRVDLVQPPNLVDPIDARDQVGPADGSGAGQPVVVVGVDGSDGSRDAVLWAAGQATSTGAVVRAVATWRWPNYVTRIPPGVDLRGETARSLQEVVAPVRAMYPALEISEVVVDGPAGPALLTQARDAALLVVGARGRAAFPGMLVGSVAEYCVRHGPCPVVVVRSPGPTSAV